MNMQLLPNVSIGVLNWNGRDDTLACFASLRHLSYTNYRLLVVDNGSTDNSIAAIRADFPEVELTETNISKTP